MIVPRVVVPSLDSLHLHSANYHNPVVHSDRHHLWEAASQVLNQHTSAGTAVMTKTTTNYLVKCHLSLVWARDARLSRSGKGRLWSKNVNLEELNRGDLDMLEMEIAEQVVDHCHSVIDNS
jgi:hypothetical protein